MTPDADVLQDYMQRFIGFGSAEAPMWFIGLEQGGGETLAELDRRLRAWTEMGGQAFADLPDYCRRIGEGRWHGSRARIQPTLGKLVRIVLAAHGIEPTPERIRSYQSERFATTAGDTMIGELMPLPSRSVSEWIYTASGLPDLATRDAYVQAWQPRRIALLKDAIAVAKPAAVVCLGVSAQPMWSAIAGVRFTPGPGGAFWASSETTRFIVCCHPTAFGARNDDFDAIGRALHGVAP
jgi:hypothetical protein